MWRKQDCLASADVAARLGTFRSRWARAAADGAAAARRGRRQRARKARIKQGLAGEPWRDKKLRRARGRRPLAFRPGPFALRCLPFAFALCLRPLPSLLALRRGPYQASNRRSTSEALVPPKPNEFDRAVSI